MDEGVWVWLAMFLAVFAGAYKVHGKAGFPGWTGLVPFYSFWIQLKIVDRPEYWMGLYFVPFAYLYVVVRSNWDIGTCFGKGTGFKWGLILMPFVFWPILGFGSATYRRRVPPPMPAPGSLA